MFLSGVESPEVERRFKQVAVREREKIVKAAGVVSGATLVSRILGFFRDMVIAQAFGAGLSTDAFFVAFRIPYLFRRLLGEGSLTASFIPVFTETRERGDRGEDREMVSSGAGALLVIVLGITLAGIIFAPSIIKIIAPGFGRSMEKLELTIALTRLIFPYLIFVSFFALYMGVLNSTGHFFAPAAAPALLNLSMIAAALCLAPKLAEPIYALAWGVLFGGLLQMAFQMPFMKSRGYLVRPKLLPVHKGIKKVSLLMAPALLGLAAGEINLMVDTLLASFLPEGSVSFLYYGNRLVQFPLGIFGIALGTAIFPSLSAEAARMEVEKLKETMVFGLRMVLFVTLPAMVGLIALAGPIIALLFQRGAFTRQSTVFTAQALAAYAIGLWAFTAVKILVPTFYSLKDTRTPFLISLVAVFSNIILNIVLMIPLKHAGLALATSLSAVINVVLLVFFLRRKIGLLGMRSMVRKMAGPVLASGVMGLFCVMLVLYFGESIWLGFTVRFKVVITGVLLGSLIYFSLVRFMGVEELSFILNPSTWSRSGDISGEGI